MASNHRTTQTGYVDDLWVRTINGLAFADVESRLIKLENETITLVPVDPTVPADIQFAQETFTQFTGLNPPGSNAYGELAFFPGDYSNQQIPGLTDYTFNILSAWRFQNTLTDNVAIDRLLIRAFEDEDTGAGLPQYEDVAQWLKSITSRLNYTLTLSDVPRSDGAIDVSLVPLGGPEFESISATTLRFGQTVLFNVPAFDLDSIALPDDVVSTLLVGTGVVVTTGSTAVTVTGGALITQGFTAGQYILLGGSYYEIASVDSATTLTLTTNYSGDDSAPLSVEDGNVSVVEDEPLGTGVVVTAGPPTVVTVTGGALITQGFTAGQYIYIGTFGYRKIASIDSETTLTLVNAINAIGQIADFGTVQIKTLLPTFQEKSDQSVSIVYQDHKRFEKIANDTFETKGAVQTVTGLIRDRVTTLEDNSNLQLMSTGHHPTQNLFVKTKIVALAPQCRAEYIRIGSFFTGHLYGRVAKPATASGIVSFVLPMLPEIDEISLPLDDQDPFSEMYKVQPAGGGEIELGYHHAVANLHFGPSPLQFTWNTTTGGGDKPIFVQRNVHGLLDGPTAADLSSLPYSPINGRVWRWTQKWEYADAGGLLFNDMEYVASFSFHTTNVVSRPVFNPGLVGITGTEVVVTTGSTAVTVTGGDLIVDGVLAGQTLVLDSVYYIIASVDSATTLTLTTNYSGDDSAPLSMASVKIAANILITGNPDAIITTNGSTAVTVTGGALITQGFTAGQYILLEGHFYRIASIDSETTLTLQFAIRAGVEEYEGLFPSIVTTPTFVF